MMCRVTAVMLTVMILKRFPDVMHKSEQVGVAQERLFWHACVYRAWQMRISKRN